LIEKEKEKANAEIQNMFQWINSEITK